MKLRIKDNSIRLRLTRGEVDRISTEGMVEAAVAFADGGKVRYALERSGSGGTEASWSERGLVVRVPEAMLRDWAGSEQVSISASQPLPEGSLRILVEKDFACLTPREGEDESDMFPHPLEKRESS